MTRANGNTTATVYRTPAVPCWTGLLTGDLPAARDFYGRLLGWGYSAAPGGGLLAQAGGATVATLGDGGAAGRATWTPYFGTEDADLTAELVRECGGTLAFGPIDGDLGRIAVAADAQGAVFGVWQTDGTVGGSPYGTGTPAGTELRSPDPFTAALFYAEVFEWDRRAAFDLAYEQDRVVVRHGREPVVALRGAASDAGPARWEVAFAVPDADAAARAAAEAGAVVRGVADGPSGRRAELVDPQGAEFGLLAAVGGGR